MAELAPSHPLDPTAALPLYLQLQRAVEQEMRTGDWRPPAALPSEAELSARYGVSRATVRHALQRLTERGLIHRHAGRGSFALAPKASVRLDRYVSFSEELEARGHVPGSRLLDLDVVAASELVAQSLGVAPGTLVVRLRRLRLADGLVVAHSLSHIRADLVPEMDRDDLSSPAFSLHRYLRRRFGIQWIESYSTLRPSLLDAGAAPHLEQAIGTPIFEMRTLNYVSGSGVAEFSHDLFRADRMVVELRSTATPAPESPASASSLAGDRGPANKVVADRPS